MFSGEKRGKVTGLLTDLLCEAIVGKPKAYRAVAGISCFKVSGCPLVVGTVGELARVAVSRHKRRTGYPTKLDVSRCPEVAAQSRRWWPYFVRISIRILFARDTGGSEGTKDGDGFDRRVTTVEAATIC